MSVLVCNNAAPLILQSDNGREFVNQVVKEVLKLWPECKMVNGKARHSQSQGSVERCNRDIENMVACYLRDNNTTKWAEALQFVQYSKNARHHTGIGRSPFMAHLGFEAQLGVQTLNLDKEITNGIMTEEELSQILPKERFEGIDNENEVHTVENVNEVHTVESVT